MNQDKILIIDIETTGFRPDDEIVEIGIVELNIDSGAKNIIYDEIFKPQFITEEELNECWIVEKGFMTTADIFKGDLIDNQVMKIQNILFEYSNGITAFNNEFDFRFLERVGLVFPKKLPCPMKLSRKIVDARGKNGRNKNPSAKEAWDFYFGIATGYIQKHRGADDALHEADIVFELIKRGVFKI